MGKLLTYIIIFSVMSMSMFLFIGTDYTPEEALNITTNNTIMSGMVDFQSYLTFNIWTWVMPLLTISVGIAIGTLLTKSEWPIYAGIGAGFFVFVVSNMIRLYQNMADSGILGPASLSAGVTILSIIFGILGISFIFAIIEFARGRD